MATFKQFEDLEIWQKARSLFQRILAITQKEQVQKNFRFCSQIREAAGSVMDNIAEGFERDSRLEFINFLSIAKGSCGEVRSQLYRALDQKYITTEEQTELKTEYKNLGAYIANFIRYLNKSEIKEQKFLGRN